MEFSHALEQKITMKLSSQMYSSLEVLQLSNVEFIQYLNEKSVENVLLELESSEIIIGFSQHFKEGDRNNNQQSMSKENYLLESHAFEIFSEREFIERWVLEQVNVKLSNKEMEFLTYLVQNMNGHGYIEVILDDAATGIGVTYRTAEKILKIIQNLEPVGIGARSIKECLLLQIEREVGEKDLSYQIIDMYYQQFLNHDFKKIADGLQCTMKEIKTVVGFLQGLTIRPLEQYIPQPAQYIIPDIVIQKSDAGYIVDLNKSHIPKLTISNLYEQSMGKLDEMSIKFLNNHMEQAMGLIGSIRKREETLLKLGMTILHLQSDFLTYGTVALKPMRLKDIAEELGMHQSTISRAVRQKYIQTPVGIFELSSLFVNGIEGEDGQVLSTQTVKEYIKTMIREEDRGKPLSDQKIGDILKEKGISISRRTVAKYRGALGIVSSVQRIQC